MLTDILCVTDEREKSSIFSLCSSNFLRIVFLQIFFCFRFIFYHKNRNLSICHFIQTYFFLFFLFFSLPFLLLFLYFEIKHVSTFPYLSNSLLNTILHVGMLSLELMKTDTQFKVQLDIQIHCCLLTIFFFLRISHVILSFLEKLGIKVSKAIEYDSRPL